MENEIQFEQRVINHLSSAPRIIIKKNTSNCRGFTGRRKPDLVTIETNLELKVWELKSPKECAGTQNDGHMWLRHPNSQNDYIALIRQKHANNTQIPVNVRGWCVVIDGELRYWINNHGNFWKLPFEYTNQISKAVIAAPADQETAINQALTHLNLNWNIVVVDNITLAEGVY